MNELKEACGRYYSHTEEKEVNGTVMYKTVPSPGARHLPLGLFKTEEAAVEALHTHLKIKNLI